jgi:hypothetical protein
MKPQAKSPSPLGASLFTNDCVVGIYEHICFSTDLQLTFQTCSWERPNKGNKAIEREIIASYQVAQAKHRDAIKSGA